METKELQAALDLLNNPQLLRVQLEKDLLTKADTQSADMPSKEISAELLRGISESLDDVKPQYKALREQLLKKQDEQHRDLTQAIDLAGKAYGVVKDHWAEIYFILNILNKKGHLDKLKKNPILKSFFETLFDK
jgi:LPS O-antigen subunit length determinant protein (WzzB/FepE family)